MNCSAQDTAFETDVQSGRSAVERLGDPHKSRVTRIEHWSQITG